MAEGIAENATLIDWPEASEMLARAEALVPALKERALETEQIGKVHPDTIKELHETGLFRLNQLAHVGGGDYEIITQ
jgi:3-hydroxy-9,10-secoandrosta-1,3,5(10)-triene-9,17-dione monooxygenase